MDCVVLYQGVDGGFFKHGWYDLEHVVGRDGKRWRERETSSKTFLLHVS